MTKRYNVLYIEEQKRGKNMAYGRRYNRRRYNGRRYYYGRRRY